MQIPQPKIGYGPILYAYIAVYTVVILEEKKNKERQKINKLYKLWYL